MTSAAPKSSRRKDFLIGIEEKVQALWNEKGVYEMDAPAPGEENPNGKYFVTFPYPYMNGKMHIGHAFSLTKAEFAARFQRMLGKDVLWPFGFHCTGMPICAAANKLRKELETINDSSSEPSKQQLSPQRSEDKTAANSEVNPGVFKSKKGKVAQKGGDLSQADILRSLDVPEEEIPKFVDPSYWLEYFPPFGMRDLKRFGVACDWRRSFITTDANPYYDAFIRWQYNILNQRGRLKFGNRATIYAPVDDQPCADHDRASGEGVNPQEYTLIKLQVQQIPEAWLSAVGGDKVYFVAATLRPETMYGQTNCFVLPDGEYGLYRMNDGEVFVCSYRSALNMVYQKMGPKESLNDGTKRSGPVELLTVSGRDLLGLPLSAPFAKYDTVYALPMLTISMNKGTGIVTSVPADSPDDYACLRDWQTRANWREQYGIKEEWVKGFEVVPIIKVAEMPEWGDASAPFLVESLKIDTHKQKDKLEEAKKQAYQKGFYQGVMIAGSHAGLPVQEAKGKVREELISKKLACAYFEPEKEVVSRSGDDCVVAFCDQWYLTYGDKDWEETVLDHVRNRFEFFNKSALNQQEKSVEWFQDWACSRTFGLGSKLPWDTKWVIESLSDSTIYMAYYTIAHLLQGGDIAGGSCGPLGVTPDQMTDEVFDYVFGLSPHKPESTIASDKIEALRREFQYWYPVDLRCSARDLISNHFTMALYHHAAVWEDQPEMMPRAFFANGMIVIDGEKMSKSKGNFITVKDACENFTADATRISLADSGDELEKANFKRKTADDAILTLTTLEEWARNSMDKIAKGELREGDFNFLDEAFDNEMNILIEAAHRGYSSMQFRVALKAAWFDLLNLRSQYQVLTEGSGMHAALILRYLEVQALLAAPVIPHFAEHLWSTLLKNEGSVVLARWPELTSPVCARLSRKYQVLQSNLREFRLELNKVSQPPKKQKPGMPLPLKPTSAVIFVSAEYKKFQQAVLQALQDVELDEEFEPVNKKYMASLKDHEAIKALDKQDQSQCLKFASFHMQNEVKARGLDALELSLPFDEAEMLSLQIPLIKKQLGLSGSVSILKASEGHPADKNGQKAANAQPGKATILFQE